MGEKADKPVSAAPEKVKPTKEQILVRQAELFKLRERYQHGIAQCNAQINELEGMLKEV